MVDNTEGRFHSQIVIPERGLKMSDKAMYGYAAGLVDGEGTITVCRSEYDSVVKNRNNKVYHHIGFHVKVSIKNTDERLMKWLQSRFGGEYYTDESSLKKNPTWKPSFVWHHAAKDKEPFLLAILPYLIIKKEQAILALEFIRLGYNVRCPEKRQELYEKILALNQRGKPVETITQDVSDDTMIESVLTGDSESTPA